MNMSKERYMEYASVGQRVSAALIDWTLTMFCSVIGGIGIAIVFLISAIVTYKEYMGASFAPLATVVIVFPASLSIAPLAYLIHAFNSEFGDTYGNRQMRISIRTIEMKRINKRRAILRHILGSPLLMSMLLSITPLWTPYIIIVILGEWFEILDELAESIANMSLYFWFIWGVPAVSVFVVAPVLALANHVYMIFDIRNRGWQDRIAGTVVIKNSINTL